MPINHIDIYSYIPFQYIEGKIPSYNSTSKDERVVLTLTNSISKEIIYTNSSFELANLNKNETNEASSEITAPEHWPIWLQHVTCISHLMLAFNSSVNFFIYYMKRKTLNIGMNLVSTANVHLAFAERIHNSYYFFHDIVGQTMTVSHVDETIRMSTMMTNEA